MDTAESLDRQARQREITRQERNDLRETTIREKSVNEMSIPMGGPISTMHTGLNMQPK